MSNKDKQTVGVNWWEPAELRQAEIVQRTSDTPDPKNDFGSYRLLLSHGIKSSQIESHNEVNPGLRARFLRLVLKGKLITSILDVGCGAGFTTDTLKSAFPEADVLGVDISLDSIAYAKKSFQSCEFKSLEVNPDKDPGSKRYSLVCCFEFYPFTRSNDIQTHSRYLKYLCNLLEVGGCLVLWQQWYRSSSLYETYSLMEHTFPEYEFEIFDVPIRALGSPVVPLWLASALTGFVRQFMSAMKRERSRVGMTKCLVITPRRACD